MPKALMAVWSDPSDPASEAEYNAWYESTHIPDVLKIPGFVACTRYKVAETQFGPVPTPASYVAFYEIEVDDLSSVPEAMGKAFAAGELPMSDSITPGPIVLFEQAAGR
jgi:uncharacterized protein (TIGR02118 family)